MIEIAAGINFAFLTPPENKPWLPSPDGMKLPESDDRLFFPPKTYIETWSMLFINYAKIILFVKEPYTHYVYFTNYLILLYQNFDLLFQIVDGV